MTHPPAACLRAALAANAPAHPCQACEAVAADLARENPRLAGALRRLGFLRGNIIRQQPLTPATDQVDFHLTRTGAKP